MGLGKKEGKKKLVLRQQLILLFGDKIRLLSGSSDGECVYLYAMSNSLRLRDDPIRNFSPRQCQDFRHGCDYNSRDEGTTLGVSLILSCSKALN
jgi:hypothetical protein